MSVWREKVAVLICTKNEILMVDMAKGKHTQTIQLGDKEEELVDFKSRPEEFGTAVLISSIKEFNERNITRYLCFHHFDLLLEEEIKCKRIRVPEGELMHCLSNSLKKFVYFASNILVLAKIYRCQDVQITLLLDDIDNVFKIAPYGDDDFLIYFKRRSTGEVFYYLTHER